MVSFFPVPSHQRMKPDKQSGSNGRYLPQPVSVLGPAPTLSPSFLLVRAIFEPNLSPYKYPNILYPVILHTYLSMNV
jgi:hypothetical protein